MPTYGGGKSRLGKEISKVIEKIEEKYDFEGDYFEPFCGLLGVGINFAKKERSVLACDANTDLILMWKRLKRGWDLPKTCTKDKYDKLRETKRHSAEKGFLGIACAYSGIYFAGYRVSDNNGNNFFKRTRDGLNEMTNYLDYVKFLPSSSYDEFNPKGMTIYCDPPYINNKFKSEFFDNFDHEYFWETMRKWSKHNLVLISEYTAPNDFKTVWKKEMKTTHQYKSRTRTEKLFMYKYSGIIN